MYYPQSQIITNLYTNGKELVIKSNSLNYVGSYYKISTGKMYAGEKPSAGKIELIPIEDLNSSSTLKPNKTSKTITVTQYSNDPDPEGLTPSPDDFYSIKNNSLYSNLKAIPSNRLIPSPYTPTITPSDLNLEEIFRYFAKKRNQNLYLEISPDDFLALKTFNSKIAFDLYESISIPWSLSFDASLTNRNLVNNIERNKKWYGFHHFFKGRFGLYDSTQEALYTDGGEFLFPDRTDYIGYYHYMPNGNVMTGRYHGDGVEIILIPLKNINPTSTSTSTSTPTSSPSTSGDGGGGY